MDVDCANELGEGILWDDRARRFIWTDIQRKSLWTCNADGSQLEQRDLPARLASFALTDRSGVIFGAFDRGLAIYSLNDGHFEWVNRPDLPPGVRFNDGRVDRAGNFLVGTMVEDATQAGGTDKGGLFRVEPDFALTKLLDNIQISNSLSFSPCGQRMYHADTPSGSLSVYSYAGGQPQERQILYQYHGDEGPDGACVDSKGNIWLAIWGGGRVDCIAPNGALLRSVAVGAASQLTCPAFGGEALDQLAVTSAWEGLVSVKADRPGKAGNVFIKPIDCHGIPESRLALA